MPIPDAGVHDGLVIDRPVKVIGFKIRLHIGKNSASDHFFNICTAASKKDKIRPATRHYFGQHLLCRRITVFDGTIGEELFCRNHAIRVLLVIQAHRGVEKIRGRAIIGIPDIQLSVCLLNGRWNFDRSRF